MIARLKMPLGRRIGVCVLLGLGFIVVIAGSVRSYFVWKSLIASYDLTWYSFGLYISAAVEIDLGVVRTARKQLVGEFSDPSRCALALQHSDCFLPRGLEST